MEQVTAINSELGRSRSTDGPLARTNQPHIMRATRDKLGQLSLPEASNGSSDVLHKAYSEPNSVRPCGSYGFLEAAHASLRGHFLYEEFISKSEEIELVDMVDQVQPAWINSNFNGPHRGKAWGFKMDLKERKVLPATHELPPLLQRLAERMRASLPMLRDFHPTEANAIDYRREDGHVLRAHVDNRQLSTGEIVTLSLQGRAIMTFARAQGKVKDEVHVPLPRRGLQVLTGEARYAFTHAIHREHFHDSRRVSITFRQSPLRL